MKNMKKKGFTIVELVIVIAVIAILAAVLIPTFSNVVEKANQNSAMQAARSEYELYLGEYAKDLDRTQNLVIIKGDYAFEVTNGQFNAEAKKASDYNTQAATTDLSKVYTKVTTTITAGSTDVSSYYTKSAEGVYVKASGVAQENTEYYAQSDLGFADVAIYVVA